MILRIHRRSNPFVMVDKKAIEDKRLTWRARGLLVYFLSKPDKWKVQVDQVLRISQEGRDAVRGAMRELRDAGYAKLVATSRGKEWVILEEPEPQPENPSMGVDPQPENPSMGQHPHYSKGTPEGDTYNNTGLEGFQLVMEESVNKVLTPEKLRDAWNEQKGLLSVRKLTAARCAEALKRLRDKEWAENAIAGIVRVGKSHFCCGGGRDGWKANFDWFLRKNTLVNILEGKYDNRGGAEASESARDMAKTGFEPKKPKLL